MIKQLLEANVDARRVVLHISLQNGTETRSRTYQIEKFAEISFIIRTERNRRHLHNIISSRQGTARSAVCPLIRRPEKS
jgi:hypothetical protein